MKNLLLIGALAALGGCATYPASPRYAQPSDPSQWHVVSVTPVAPGTGERVAAASPTGSRIEYSSRPVTVVERVYVPQPVYVPAPVYIEEPAYYYPPVTLSLGFGFGHYWGHGGRGSAYVGRGWRHR
ncbi:hypothetical protein LXA47_22670 [Massilia sp. P8910]|uniref:hypothetical protein n=1 Tax=Massilia antarctica TaxID=2765360 RepID=UPI0006BB7718|nr:MULTISPECIES: hypothetical protein [Massilia]MCE3606386.1 hypothetical protein [Massilia antarctica]MCY0910379.1 hypothetical protein [Massilia sp. H27-R4]CUI09280.1 hypothetical protein BN2497_13337 [Janthinobacterium sp. CG23_2]CUU33066.1 hypothetical protein BN3177_13337 [Janthinobacterium sp. CG23_2]